MILSALRLRPRLLIAIAFGAAVALLLPGTFTALPRTLLAWSGGVVLYSVLIVWNVSRASIEGIRRQASRLDDSAPVILTFALLATVASFAAISSLLLAPAQGSKGPEAFDVILGASTMVLSWLFTQVVFSIHYMHIFYGDVDGSQRGGLQFGGNEEEPDFWDFVYFTTSIGATAQTSDTVVTSKRMRRIVAAQAVYSFFFNTAVLALAINIAAGLAGH